MSDFMAACITLMLVAFLMAMTAKALDAEFEIADKRVQHHVSQMFGGGK